jgi:hypothetical protein
MSLSYRHRNRISSLTATTSIARRLLKPILLVSPLALLLVIPAFVYGLSSNRAAAEADAALVAAVMTDEKGLTVDPSFVCSNALVNRGILSFATLNVGASAQKSSLSGFGFDEAVVDLRGRLNGPETAIEGEAAGGDDETNITVHLRHYEGHWCLYDLEVTSSG